jgi:hypothetical protein
LNRRIRLAGGCCYGHGAGGARRRWICAIFRLGIDQTMSQLMSDLAFLICAFLAAITSVCLVVVAVF